MEFKHEFYIKDADPVGTQEALAFLNEFYRRYPTGNELAEALHQYRREHNLIIEVEAKRRRVKKLQEEIDEMDQE